MMVRVGIDVGRTSTDVVAVTGAGEVVVDKVPTTVEDPSRGIALALAQLADRLGLTPEELGGRMEVVVHGTTVADDTMAERRGATVGLLVGEGPREELELRRSPGGPAGPPPGGG